MYKDLLPPRLPITLGGKETFLQYGTFPSMWYLEENKVDLANIFGNMKFIDVLHLLRAGLIQANFEENKAIIDNGTINKVKPTLSELAMLLNETTYAEVQTQIIEAMIKSMPKRTENASRSSNVKKKSIFYISRLFGAIFSNIRKKVICKRVLRRLSKHLTSSQN